MVVWGANTSGAGQGQRQGQVGGVDEREAARTVLLPATEAGLARAQTAVELVQRASEALCPPAGPAHGGLDEDDESPFSARPSSSSSSSTGGEPRPVSDSYAAVRGLRRRLLLEHGSGFLQEFARRLCDPSVVDYAFDRMGARHMAERLPPPEVAPADEGKPEVSGSPSTRQSEGGGTGGCPAVPKEWKGQLVRLRFPRHTHMSVQGGVCVVQHAASNTRRFKEAGVEAGLIELPMEAAPAVELLVKSWPAWLSPTDLPVLDGSPAGDAPDAAVADALEVMCSARLVEFLETK